MLDRFRKWKANGGADSSSDSEDDEKDAEQADPGWEFGTVKGAPKGLVVTPAAGGGKSGAAAAASSAEELSLRRLQKVLEGIATNSKSAGKEVTAIGALQKQLTALEASNPGFAMKVSQAICVGMNKLQ